MRASLHNSPADKARQGEIILRRPWQRMVFFGGLAAPILLLLLMLLLTATGH